MALVKLTVMKCDYDPALAEAYGDSAAQGPCTLFHEGQIIYCDKHYMPQGFCDDAWKVMAHHVYAIFHDETRSIGGRGWMREARTACVTCPNGLGPVTFLIEGLEEDPEILRTIPESW